MIIHGAGRITSYLLDGTARMGTCFPMLGQLIDDKKATLTTRSKTGEDGQPTPTKEITGGSKLDKFDGNYGMINGIKTVQCDFNKVEPINEEDGYTSSETTKGRNLTGGQQDPQTEIGTTSILKTKFKLMGWKLTEEQIQHHNREGETRSRKEEHRQGNQQEDPTTETTKGTRKTTPDNPTRDKSQGTPGKTTRKRRTSRKREEKRKRAQERNERPKQRKRGEKPNRHKRN
jgi:hypothetical protein